MWRLVRNSSTVALTSQSEPNPFKICKDCVEFDDNIAKLGICFVFTPGECKWRCEGLLYAACDNRIEALGKARGLGVEVYETLAHGRPDVRSAPTTSRLPRPGLDPWPVG
eukprot:scaffold47896_cov16-Prasinocladus_malaysianus.AAC.1